ncbi:MAG TPA: translation elongation factor Ts, partial [Gemmataceae bacterium]|nr:translation elongation factor Ts [Gemmataceae bacterium]
MSISANDVKTLRDRTNAPMMDCKKALTEAGGDMAKAIQWLREKNAKIQVSKGDREAAEGRIAIFIDPVKKVGAILEMRCESPPVVKAEHFVKLANEIARQIALQNPASVDELIKQPSVDDPAKTVNDVIGDVVGLIRENMKPKRFTRLTGLLGDYCHHDGSVGVLLQVEGEKADPQLLRDICMHVTAKNPVSARREDVPQEVIAKELEIAKAQAATTGKPANIVEKI